MEHRHRVFSFIHAKSGLGKPDKAAGVFYSEVFNVCRTFHNISLCGGFTSGTFYFFVSTVADKDNFFTVFGEASCFTMYFLY